MKVRIQKKSGGRAGCLLCGKPIVYRVESAAYTCAVCGGVFEANSSCQDGHFVCDACHAPAHGELVTLLLSTKEADPARLFAMAAGLGGVHMHGPEHHVIVPCVLLAAYCKSGGAIDLPAALETAVKRGGQVPGGACGFWGACGAAIGAGLYASIVLGSNPLHATAWGIPQTLTARCLEKIAEIGGPRCCKRTARIAIETAAAFTGEHFGVTVTAGDDPCGFHAQNRECLRTRCPYYGGHDHANI